MLFQIRNLLVKITDNFLIPCESGCFYVKEILDSFRKYSKTTSIEKFILYS